MVLSNQELGDYGGFKAQPVDTTPPLPYNKGTRTSFGAHTTWTRKPGMGISKQSQGSFLTFDEEAPTSMPQSDKGANFLKG